MKPCEWEDMAAERVRKRLRCYIRPGERCVPLRNDEKCTECIEKDCAKSARN